MSFKLSDRFLEAVADAAEKLSEEHPVVRLDGIYSMFQVRLQMPEINFTSYTFEELGIEKKGSFYLCSESIL